ncbi:MAG: peptidoglycan recognition family protein [Nannocystaceae bacterium]
MAVTSGDATTTGDAAPAPPYVDRLIRYDDERTALTLEYRKLHEGGDPQDAVITPRMVVLHHTGGPSADAAWRYFNRPTIESGRATLAKAGRVNVGAQFLVDRDGTILRLIPEDRHARHCVGLNHLAIGVENVGDGKAHPLTEAQIDADARLIRYLAATFPITHVIGHNEALAMREHPYFHEEVPGYKTRKGDPGPAFMAAVRERIADLGLEGPPAADAAAK